MINHSKNVVIKESEGLLGLSEVIAEYLRIVESYSNVVEGDYCFGYTEAACTTNFAAACISKNWATLAEYQHTKIDKKKGSRTLSGRNDLYISNGESHFFCEAKIGFMNMSQGENKWKGMLDKTWNNADRDLDLAITNPESANEPGLAISFFCVTLLERGLNKAGKRMHALREYCEEQKDRVDAMGWYLVSNPSLEWKPDIPVGHLVTIKAENVDV